MTQQAILSFENAFTELLDKHAPTKKKALRANNKPYVFKRMRKTIMKRSELATKFRKVQLRKTVELTRSKKIIAANYIRRKGENSTQI